MGFEINMSQDPMEKAEALVSTHTLYVGCIFFLTLSKSVILCDILGCGDKCLYCVFELENSND